MSKIYERFYPSDKHILKLIDSQKDRNFCEFKFKNNLKDNTEIVYLKISHVFEGRDAFVYETNNLKNNESFIIEKYALGANYSTKKEKDITIVSKDVIDSKEENLNTYDRLFIHFVVRDQFGKLKLYHHQYSQLYNKKKFDLFNFNHNIDENFMNLMSINVVFDPKHNGISHNELKLCILLSTPYFNLNIEEAKNIK